MEWAPRTVVTTSLQMTSPSQLQPAGPMPGGVRFERLLAPTPEFVRWLYAAVGGPWTWTDRINWTRAQWVSDLALPGTEIWVAYADGAPAGYVHLGPSTDGDAEAVEIKYFGLLEHAIGRGIGGALLTHAVRRAWALAADHGLPPARRVWLHTCSLDGPAALPNYRARGFVEFAEVSKEETVPVEPLGAWVSTGGPQ
ncbi:GNAT family N-acetyltransferase [Branchiibius cervicis]|uniref:GNAT family N-acetyltransferase n=1 Tax=Branchiibius cervicis TaxID=908252 RepID=A0ABW2AYT1_9MICO